MRIYWSIDAIPELTGFTKEERRGIWQRHCWRIWRSWRAWGAVAIYFIVTSLLIVLCAASSTLVPDYMIDPEIAPIIGAALGTLPAVMIGGSIFAVLRCEIIRNEIRKTLSSGLSPDVLASWVICRIRWSWIGCGGGGLSGAVVGAVVGCFAGFVGGGAGCGVGGIGAGRKLAVGGTASAQFSIGLIAGALNTIITTLLFAVGILVLVLMTR